MGIFSAILDKLRNRGAQASQQSGAPGSQSTTGRQASADPQQQQRGAQSAQAGGGTGAQAAPQSVLKDVDVEAVLAQMAAQKGGGNYKQSIVDLLKLLDLDSSLTARKELADELNVRAGADGSAEQNIALHKAVMRKIAENGGKVPDSLRN